MYVKKLKKKKKTCNTLGNGAASADKWRTDERRPKAPILAVTKIQI